MALRHTISYTSRSEGITIGVTGDSFAEALQGMVTYFGEGIVPLFGSAQTELRSICESVSVSKEDLDQVNAEVPGTISVSTEQEPDSGGSGDGPHVETDPEHSRWAGTDSGGDQGDEDSGGVGPGEVAAEVLESTTTGPSCSVCGAAITADRALASRLTLGEERCTNCTK